MSERRCPKCGSVYTDTGARFCPKDGSMLVEIQAKKPAPSSGSGTGVRTPLPPGNKAGAGGAAAGLDRASTLSNQILERAQAIHRQTGSGQPDRRHQIAACEFGQHPGVDPVGFAGQRCEAFHFLRVGDLDLPALKLEPIVHEARAVHRLDRRVDRLAMTIESLSSRRSTVICEVLFRRSPQPIP